MLFHLRKRISQTPADAVSDGLICQRKLPDAPKPFPHAIMHILFRQSEQRIGLSGAVPRPRVELPSAAPDSRDGLVGAWRLQRIGTFRVRVAIAKEGEDICMVEKLVGLSSFLPFAFRA